MRAEVKRLWSIDLELLDARSLPSNPEECCVVMQADIGPVGEEGADTFNFEVCTPSGLAARLDADGRPYWGRGTLVLRSFSWEAVEAALNQYVRSVSGEDWAEVASKLSRFMLWEFEDYQPYKGN
jgi:hypothetical protein